MGVMILEIALVICILGWTVTIIYNRNAEKKLLNSLEAMLEQALNGTYTVDVIDETQLSSIENQLYRYITNCGTAMEDIEEQRRMIKSLIGDISHQTITPISNIHLYTQLLSEEIEELNQPLQNSNLQTNQQQQDNPLQQMNHQFAASALQKTGAISEQTRKLEFLIQSMVKMSRLETGMIQVEPQQIQVSEMFRELYLQLQLKAEEKKLILQFQDTSLTAYCDKKWTMEALANIIDNAIKYTGDKGNVTILAEAYPMFLKIDVTDTGIGMTEEEQCQVFQRFYRSPTVSQYPGVELDLHWRRILSVCKKVILN